MLVTIETIDDVLPHLTLGNGISVLDRPGNHKTIDYGYQTNDTFDSDMALQCRGLKFDSNGRIIARPFHKFFNIYEREDPTQIDWSRPHVIMDKMDGSMVHPAMLNGEMVFMTRMGVTRHSEAAYAHATAGVLDLCRAEIAAGRTPMFEYTGPENRIVLAYDAPALTLLASREMVSGAYLSHDALLALGERFGVAVAASFGSVAEIRAFIEESRALPDIEGYVIAFDDGHRLKLKTDGYVLRHRAFAGLHNEKNVLNWVVEDAVDDVIPLISEEAGDRVKAYRDAVMRSVMQHVATIEGFHAAHKDGPRKDYAIAAGKTLPKPLVSAAFAVLDGGSARDAVMKHLAWAGHSETRVDQVRKLYDLSWSTEGFAEPEAT